MLLFASKKIFATACNNFRNLFDSAESVEFQRESYYSDYIRLSGKICGFNYQVHINSAEIANRVKDLKPHTDTDAELIKIFAFACACGDYGQMYKKYEYLSKSLVLNY